MVWKKVKYGKFETVWSNGEETLSLSKSEIYTGWVVSISSAQGIVLAYPNVRSKSEATAVAGVLMRKSPAKFKEYVERLYGKR